MIILDELNKQETKSNQQERKKTIEPTKYSCGRHRKLVRNFANKGTTTSKFKSQLLPIVRVFCEAHLHGLLPVATNRPSAERKTATAGAPTDRATVALDASSLHSNCTALRKRVLRACSRNAHLGCHSDNFNKNLLRWRQDHQR